LGSHVARRLQLFLPEDRYGAFDGQNRTSYLAVAAVLMSFDSLGEAAVHELLRRFVVNELLGNPDMHLKNIGLLHPGGVRPTLSPAYDVVAYSVSTRTMGHALQIMRKEIFRPENSLQTGRHVSSGFRPLSFGLSALPRLSWKLLPQLRCATR
jgi:serine/threonine-protein kinase HipA